MILTPGGMRGCKQEGRGQQQCLGPHHGGARRGFVSARGTADLQGVQKGCTLPGSCADSRNSCVTDTDEAKRSELPHLRYMNIRRSIRFMCTSPLPGMTRSWQGGVGDPPRGDPLMHGSMGGWQLMHGSVCGCQHGWQTSRRIVAAFVPGTSRSPPCCIMLQCMRPILSIPYQYQQEPAALHVAVHDP